MRKSKIKFMFCSVLLFAVFHFGDFFTKVFYGILNTTWFLPEFQTHFVIDLSIERF